MLEKRLRRPMSGLIVFRRAMQLAATANV